MVGDSKNLPKKGIDPPYNHKHIHPNHFQEWCKSFVDEQLLALNIRSKTTSSANSDLIPQDPCAHRFFRYFSHHWDFIKSSAAIKGWTTVKNYKPSLRVLWRDYLEESIVLGVRFGQTTRYGMADIDIGSWLHLLNDPQAFQDLRAAFEQIGLCRSVLIQSSWSEGLHLYFPLPEEVNSFDLACAMLMAIETAGFLVKNGQLELFPNPKTFKKNYKKDGFSLYNGHRLPLQPGSGSRLLDDDYAPASDNLTDFLDQMDAAAAQQDMETLKSVLLMARDWYKQRKYRFARFSSTNKAKVKQWREDTETIISEGFTDFGQTNELLKEIGKYGRVFKALEGTELQSYMVNTVTTLPRYKKYCRHQHEIQKRCHHWAKIIEPFWWPLGTQPTRHTTYADMNQQGYQDDRNSNLNQERRLDCKTRLLQTIAHLKEHMIALPRQVGARISLICETAKTLFGHAFSKRTLNKSAYKCMWHPRFDETSSETTSAEKQEEEPVKSVSKQSAVPQQTRQPEASVHSTSDDRIPPTTVIRKIDEKPKSPDPLPTLDLPELDHTPRYMKGLDGACAVQPSNGESVSNQDQGGNLEAVETVKKEEVPLPESDLDKHFTDDFWESCEFFKQEQDPNFRTSEQKLKQTKSMVGKLYRLTAEFISGFVEFKVIHNDPRKKKNIKETEIKIIRKDTVVKVLNEIHSSSLSGGTNTVLVYVKPQHNAKHWRSGLAVPWTQLEPIKG